MYRTITYVYHAPIIRCNVHVCICTCTYTLYPRRCRAIGDERRRWERYTVYTTSNYIFLLLSLELLTSKIGLLLLLLRSRALDSFTADNTDNRRDIVEKRLEFALKWYGMPESFWTYVIFTESKYNIFGSDDHFRANSRRFSRLTVLMNAVFCAQFCELYPILLTVLRMICAKILVSIGLYRAVHNFGTLTLRFFQFRSG